MNNRRVSREEAVYTTDNALRRIQELSGGTFTPSQCIDGKLSTIEVVKRLLARGWEESHILTTIDYLWDIWEGTESQGLFSPRHIFGDYFEDNCNEAHSAERAAWRRDRSAKRQLEKEQETQQNAAQNLIRAQTFVEGIKRGDTQATSDMVMVYNQCGCNCSLYHYSANAGGFISDKRWKTFTAGSVPSARELAMRVEEMERTHDGCFDWYASNSTQGFLEWLLSDRLLYQDLWLTPEEQRDFADKIAEANERRKDDLTLRKMAALLPDSVQ